MLQIMHQVFTQMYSTVSIGPSYMTNLTGFSQALPLSKTAFPIFHCRTSFFCFFPIFSSNPPSHLQKIHKISIGPEKPPRTLTFHLKLNSIFGYFLPHTEINILPFFSSQIRNLTRMQILRNLFPTSLRVSYSNNGFKLWCPKMLNLHPPHSPDYTLSGYKTLLIITACRP